MSYTVANLIIDMLDAAGVRQLFGLPGTGTLDLLDALYDKPQMRYVSVRHEQVAGSMAEGYARVARRAAVCMVHSGAGAASILPAIASAWRDKAPVIVISTDERPWTIQESGWQSFDTLPLLALVTKWNGRIHHTDEVPRIVDRALSEATSGCPGPVHISLPKDLVSEALAESSPIRRDAEQRCANWTAHGSDGGGAALVPRHRPVPPSEAVTKSAALLSGSARPLIVAGGGVHWSDAAEEVRTLAERLRGPLLTTDLSRGCLPEDHPQSLGVSGRHGFPATQKALAKADCILVLGSELIDLTVAERGTIAPETSIIRIDISAEPAVTRFPVSLDIQADARTYLRALLDELPAVTNGPSDAATFARAMKEQVQAEEAAFHAQGAAKGDALSGAGLVRDLAATLARDAMFSVDAGLHGRRFMHLPVRTPGSFHNSSGLATMSSAFCNLYGAKLAKPDCQAVALLGDSCFMMVVQDFETAVREGIAVVAVVYNNSRFGALADDQKLRFGNRQIGTRHTNPDLDELARLFGGVGERVERAAEFRPALERMLAADKPAVIDCIMPPE